MNVEAHFDESGTDANQLTVAGYIFESNKIEKFSEKCGKLFARYNLPFFHMVDCAHGSNSFSSLSQNERVQVQMQFMRLITDYSINGIVCNIKNSKGDKGSHYARAIMSAVRNVGRWADGVAFKGNISYFFESGANGQGRVNLEIADAMSDPNNGISSNYARHDFLSKSGSFGIQAADLLAWQYHKFTKNRLKDNSVRRDLRALLRHPHLIDDECGDPPRSSRIQTIEESRQLENVRHLPTITEQQSIGRSVLISGSDITIMESSIGSKSALVCPKCFRCVAEMSIESLTDIVIKCYCGAYLDTPRTIAPFLMR